MLVAILTGPFVQLWFILYLGLTYKVVMSMSLLISRSLHTSAQCSNMSLLLHLP